MSYLWEQGRCGSCRIRQIVYCEAIDYDRHILSIKTCNGHTERSGWFSINLSLLPTGEISCFLAQTRNERGCANAPLL